MRKPIAVALVGLLLGAVCGAAQEQKPQEEKQPQVRLNILNVCTPAEPERKEISTALERVPKKAAFASDFEISRGRSTLPDAPISNWVRIRRDFAAEAVFSNAQYSFSADAGGMVETLVLRVREGKDLLQIAIEDSVSGGATPATVLATDTPIQRIRLERFGKPSVALARCPSANQSVYEPLFRRGSEIMSQYRTALGARRTVPEELARLGVGGEKRPAKSAPPKPQR